MMKIGITGGIGSGKSLVCQLLEEKGYPVFYSDIVAKELMTTDNSVISKIIQVFGSNAYIQNQLNKDWIAQQIFSDEMKRQQMNDIVHPAVYQKFDEWSQSFSGLVFIESALMLDTGFYKRLDKVILVMADEKLRIQRVIKRDNAEEIAVQQRILSQTSDKEKMRLADYYLYNNEDILSVHQQLNDIIEKMVK